MSVRIIFTQPLGIDKTQNASKIDSEKKNETKDSAGTLQEDQIRNMRSKPQILKNLAWFENIKKDKVRTGKKYKCPFSKICNFKTTYGINLKRHTESVHRKKFELYQCPHCNKEINRKDNLKVHIRMSNFIQFFDHY